MSRGRGRRGGWQSNSGSLFAGRAEPATSGTGLPVGALDAARRCLRRLGELSVRGTLQPAGAFLVVDLAGRTRTVARHLSGELAAALRVVGEEARRSANRVSASYGGGRDRWRLTTDMPRGGAIATTALLWIAYPDEGATDGGLDAERAMHEAADALEVVAAIDGRATTFHVSAGQALALRG